MLKKSMLCLALTAGVFSLEATAIEKVKSSFVPKKQYQEPAIKVLILHDKPYVDIDVKGTYDIVDPYKNTRIASRFSGKGDRFESTPSGLKWSEEFPGIYQIAIIPDDPKTQTFVNGTPYLGNIYVYDIGNTLSIVNEVPIEEYLSVMMPAKYGRALSEEGMNAAAIAERTHAHFLATNSENPFWNVHGESVGYLGHQLAGTNSKVASAIQSTRYMVLSKTGLYDGKLTTLPIVIVESGPTVDLDNGRKISLDEIDALAKQGKNAREILLQEFPNTSIEILPRPEVQKNVVERNQIRPRVR